MSDNKNIKDIFRNSDIYITCSTLNQIVNYIPLKILDDDNEYNEKIKIYTITTDTKAEEGSKFKRFDNIKWDKNLENQLENLNVLENEKIEKITINSNEKFSMNLIKNKLNDSIKNGKNEQDGTYDISKIYDLKDNKKNNKIIWNITGGQRNLIFAIENFIIDNKRKDDYLIYLEGNSTKIFWRQLNVKSETYREFNNGIIDEKYSIKELDIKTVFNLAGFGIYNSSKIKNFLKKDINDNTNRDEETRNLEFSEKFLEYFEEDNEISQKVRNSLIALNKQKDDSGNKIKLEDKIKNFLKDLQLMDIYNEDEKSEAIFKKNDKDVLEKIGGNNYFKFGYILEYMTIASILNCIDKNENFKKHFAGLYHSIKLVRNDIEPKTSANNLKELCEFDIVLLTKSGQVVVFECKSGTMNSDVGKARMYTAYAAGGVYGKPVLITPLTKREKDEIDGIYFDKHDYRQENSNNKSSDKGSNDKQLVIKYDDAILEAFRAAARANLDVWAVNEMEDKLKSLFNEIL